MNDSNHGNKIGEVIFLIILLYVFAPAMLVMGTYGLIIGLLIGFVGLEFVTSRINKFQLLISEKYNIYLNDDEWFTRWFLYPPYSIANRSFQLADKIQYPTLRTGVKFALVVDSILFVVYMIILWFILSLLGDALSSSGGSSSENRPSPPMHSDSRTEKSTYTAKEKSRPFKVDKETRSSEGVLPFGIGGDIIYKTEYEDTSTGDTVKGYGWDRSEADYNARKNLKEK